jgi:cell division protein FtsZ
VQAAELAISSPLLEASIDGAHGVLLSFQGGSDLGLFEINEAARLVQEAAHPEANIIFGAVIDDALGDEVRVTVIAAGFDGGAPVRRRDDRALGQVSGRSQTTPPASPPTAPIAQPGGSGGSDAPSYNNPTPYSPPVPSGAPLGGAYGNGSGYGSGGSYGSGTYGGQTYTESGEFGGSTSSHVITSPPASNPTPPRQAEPEPESEADESAESPLTTEPLTPPRLVEVPESRPVRSQRPIVMDDEDLDVPDFLK